MRKFLLGLLLLPALVSAQVTTTLNREQIKDVHLVFKRPDGISTYYKLTGDLQVKIDESTTAVQVTTGSPLQLDGFAHTQNLTNDLFLLAALPPGSTPVVSPQPEPAPVLPTQPPSSGNWGLGQYRNRYGSNYEREKSEVAGGEASFNFYGQNVNYPQYGTSQPSTDELVVMAFPTHSVVSYYGTDFVSAVEAKLTDQDGNVVWYLNDTKGGYHPGLKANARGNNHPDDANRWIKYGKYQLWVRNKSTDPKAVQKFLFATEKGTTFVDQDLGPGQEASFELDIRKMADKFDVYKINCNVMPPR